MVKKLRKNNKKTKNNNNNKRNNNKIINKNELSIKQHLQSINNMMINNEIIIEGQLRLQDNLRDALKMFGNNFVGKLNYTKYFEFANCDELIQTLVCCDDESIILGKPSDEIKYKYCLVNILKHPIMPYFLTLNVKPICYHPNKIVNNIAIIIEQYLINKKWINSCIIINIILNEELNKLNIKNDINKGYLCLKYNGRKNASWHCWITIDNIDIDILQYVIPVVYSHDESIFNDAKLLKNIDETYYRSDKETQEEIKVENENNVLFDLYKNNPIDFWDNVKNDKILNEKYDQVKHMIDELRNIIKNNKDL